VIPLLGDGTKPAVGRAVGIRRDATDSEVIAVGTENLQRQLEESLERIVKPNTQPVAVWCLESQFARVGFERPMETLQRPIRPCEAIHYARHEGLCSLMSRPDFSSECPIGPFAFGVIPPSQDWLDGKMALHIVTDSQDVARKMVNNIPRFPAGKFESFAFAPLEKASSDFDILVIYVDSRQAMILVEAARWMTGNLVTPNITARAVCAESIIQPFLRGEPVVSIPCGGDRAWGKTQDAEIIFSIPQRAIGDLLTGLRGYHRAHVRPGLGKPTPVEVNYRPVAESIEPLLRPGRTGNPNVEPPRRAR
jgi:uncharacterized protein (DUF169 family)